jgi:hypothetical protein
VDQYRHAQQDMGHAREMRTLLERAREAQALRVAPDPSTDIRKLEIAGVEAALPISGDRVG